MSDNPWLRELARVNREIEAEERSRLDERWDRLSAGELSPEEEAELRALAEGSEEAHEAYEAFRPLGPEFQARVAGAVAAELKKPAAPAGSGEEPPARLLPFRRSAWRGWTAAVAAAAAVLFLLLRTPASSPLPLYTAELSGGTRGSRGAAEPAAGVPIFGPGDRLTLKAIPQQAAAGPVAATALLARGADLAPWDPPPPLAVAASGAVLLDGTVGREVRLPPGSWRIWLVVGPRGRLPAADEIAADLRAGRTRRAGWQAVPVDLRIADRAAP